MKCPLCGDINDRVIDSRMIRDGAAIRRRRECIACLQRFTTYEQVEDLPLVIVKKDGRRELYSREKVRAGIQKACEKRRVSMNTIEAFLEELERALREKDEKEIPSRCIGEKVMAKLHVWDDIAYVRFASVYREFKDVNDFVNELKQLQSKETTRGE